MTFGHDNFNWTPVTFGSEGTVKQQPTKTFRSVANPLWKPFMPSTWKWMRTSGTPNIFNYQNNTGETTTVSFKLPNWMRNYLRDSNGAVFPTDATGTTTVKMVAGDTFSLGGRKTVTMPDAEGGSAATTFPTLSFTQNGIPYELDWNAFSNERKIAEGGNGQDWGYPSEGQPTLGKASMYDSTIALSWNRILSPWWWLLLIGAALFGWKKYRQD